MKRLLIFLFFISFYGNSQEFRSYVDNANEADKICAAYAGKSFYSDKTANEALEKILSTIGASKRFVLSACENIPNAMAISLKGIKYIFYNREFMSQINLYTNYWSNMSILAHEVGHHINQHTVDALLILNDVVEVESLSESRKMELEADEFAGFVLAKLGATLTQASEAVALLPSNENDTYSTHPSKSKRIAAITKGHNKAKVNVISYEKTSSSTAEEYFYNAYEKKEDKYGAIADYTEAIKLKPDFAKAYAARGTIKGSLKDYDGAIADNTRAIELKPDYALAYATRGKAKYDLKDYDGAIADYTKAIKLKPDYVVASMAYFERGRIIELNWNDYYSAIADYTKAIEFDPNYANAYLARGNAKARLEDYNDAIADLTKAIELKPDNALAYLARGATKYSLGDKNGSCSDWKIAATMGDEVALELIKNACN